MLLDINALHINVTCDIFVTKVIWLSFYALASYFSFAGKISIQ